MFLILTRIDLTRVSRALASQPRRGTACENLTVTFTFSTVQLDSPKFTYRGHPQCLFLFPQQINLDTLPMLDSISANCAAPANLLMLGGNVTHLEWTEFQTNGAGW